MTPLVKEVHKLTHSAVSPAMWFDIGRVDGPAPDELANLPQLLRLPFERCALVGVDQLNYKHLCLFVQVEPDAVTAVLYFMCASGWSRTSLFAITVQNGCFAAHQVYGEETPTQEEAGFVTGLLYTWLSLLQTHSGDAYEPVIRATFTNRRKSAEGKPPSYSWNTVVVPAMQRAGVALGGTHASPRLHERRGHWSKLEGGRQVWVRDCLVGNPDLGVVEKDYKLKPEQLAPQIGRPGGAFEPHRVL